MSILRAYAVFLRHWYLVTSNTQRLVQILIWSSLDIVLWGFVSKYLGVLGVGALNFTSLLLGTLIFWNIITRIQQGYIMAFLEDSWTRNFLNMYASPITITEYIAGLVSIALASSTVSFVAGVVLAIFCFGLALPAFGLPVVILSLSLTLFAIALGILSTCLILRFGPSAEWFAWPIPAVIQPFVGVFYPVSVLPDWAQNVASILPPSYVFEGLRAIFSGVAYDWTQGLFSLMLACAYLTLAAYIFTRTHAWSIRSGAISRFGAESF